MGKQAEKWKITELTDQQWRQMAALSHNSLMSSVILHKSEGINKVN